MPVQLTSRQISGNYDRSAKWYDLVEGVPDLLGVRKLRNRLLRHASGRVLEVAVGTGKNLLYYPAGCRIIAVDVSRQMVNIARKRAAKLPMKVSFVLADAEAFLFSTRPSTP